MSSFPSSTSSENELHIKKLLYSILQKEDFTTKDSGPKETLCKIKELASEGKQDLIDHNWSASGENQSRSPDSPADILRTDDSSAFKVVNNSTLGAESAAMNKNSINTTQTIDVGTSARSSSCDKEGNANNFLFHNTALCQLLTEQRASMSNSMLFCSPHSSISSEPLHNYSRKDNRPLNEKQQQKLERKEDKHSHKKETLSQKASSAAAETIDKENNSIYSPDDIDEDPEPPQLLNFYDLLLEPNYCKAGSKSASESDNKPVDNEVDLDKDGDAKRACFPKRKRPSSSHDGQMQKKRKLQQRSTRQLRPHSKPHRRFLKSYSLLNQGPTVAMFPSAKSRLLSPSPSPSHATDTDMSPDYCNIDLSPRAVLPTLTEVTFRPHSPHCYSFTAVIRDGCDGQGVSFSQVTRLIEGIGHIRKIDDFTIKPIKQHSFLLTGFSRHTSSQPSSGGKTVSTTEVSRIHRNTTRTRPQDNKAADTGALVSRSKPSSSDDGGLSDSDPDSGCDDNKCSSKDEQDRSSTSKHSR
ncbi:hypothetical protein B0O99DRAFT_645286 [Bisporella sp. PMI_857]|nr:hypothetical protein B0O99DRAFT_645286 [Bisporella sp. PMI_857]